MITEAKLKNGLVHTAMWKRPGVQDLSSDYFAEYDTKDEVRKMVVV